MSYVFTAEDKRYLSKPYCSKRRIGRGQNPSQSMGYDNPPLYLNPQMMGFLRLPIHRLHF